jgi:hypothetical protein
VSYDVPQRSRPGSVTAAGYLLFLVAALIAIDAVVGFATAGTIQDAARKAYESAGIPNADQLSSAAVIGGIVGGVVYLLLAAGLVVLGVLDLRGKNPARIVTWVLAGIGVLCFCFGAVGGAVSRSVMNGLPSRSTNGVNPSDLARQIAQAEPSWLVPTQTTIAIINVIALILVIILLALPASNAYFRPAPLAEPGFPTYPPPYGAQPPAGGEPPYPGPPSA